MRRIAAKTVILLLAIIIAAILVAPSVDLAPAVSRTDWSACLLVVFVAWLAATFGPIALARTHAPGVQRDAWLLSVLAGGPPATSACISLVSLRC